MSNTKAGLFAALPLLLVMFGSAHAQITVDNSGTLLHASCDVPSPLAPSISAGALTLKDYSSSTAPRVSAIEFYSAPSMTASNIQISTVSPRSFAATAAFLTSADSFASFTLASNEDSFAAINNLQPVPEPSTWCAAALTAAVILWRLRHPLSGWSRPTSNSNPRL